MPADSGRIKPITKAGGVSSDALYDTPPFPTCFQILQED